MERKSKLSGIGMAAVLGYTLAITGGIEPPERNIVPRDPWDNEPRREPYRHPLDLPKSGERYDKAEAKRERKAAKRRKESNELL